jgi:3-oxoacyl-[acyl-carrier protein] reductase
MPGLGARTRDSEKIEDVLLATADLTHDDWHKMLATHLDATFYCTREALKVIMPKKSGRIINIGSIAGTAGLPMLSNYCAAKGGIISFTKSVALEVVKDGIIVNAIAPGFIETPMTARYATPEARQRMIQNTPGRFGQPKDIAAAALYLASDHSSFMVGQVISPSGGWNTA